MIYDGEREAAKARRAEMDAGNLAAALAIPEIKAMREALQFYADRETRGEDRVFVTSNGLNYEKPGAPALYEEGHRARRALAALEKDAKE